MKMTKQQIGRLGALARIKKYGNPGTFAGRRKGGINSVLKNKKLNNNFKVAKKHKIPKNYEQLAEFIGILFGDGHLSDYQILVTTNSETDIKHAFYIKKLIRNLFDLDASIKFKKKEKAINITISSVNLVKWIAAKGMPKGNKLNNGLFVPEWIKKNNTYRKNFVRGLFDTDGCVYVDRHVIKNKEYRNMGWAITSYSEKLRNDIFMLLKVLGYNPTLSGTQKSVYMRKKADIVRYFKEIGTSNPKHFKRYKNGRVPKRS